MPLIVKSNNSEYALCPPGTYASVCVDVVDLGIVESEFNGEKKKQHKLRIVWKTDEINPDTNKPYFASKRYTASLHEKASLRKDLEAWRGRGFTASECDGFDVEALVGVPALLNIIHERKGDRTFDNVASIMRLPKSMQAPATDGYIRKCDRHDESAPVPATFDSETYVPSDDDVPF